MISEKLRLKIFNWLASGKMTLTHTEQRNDYLVGSIGPTYSLNHNGFNNGPSNPLGSYNYNTQPEVPRMNLIPSINFNVAKANGGWIVQVNQPQPVNVLSIAGMSDDRAPELYLINEDADFDKELGKIITMTCLKD